MNFPGWVRQHIWHSDSNVRFSCWFERLDLLSKIALIGGILFSLYQYSAFKHAERVKYTIQLVEKFDSASNLEARQAISNALRQHEGKIAELNKMTVSPDAALKIKKRLAQFLVADANGGKGIRNELDIVVSYFNGVQICLENRICDKEVASAFLRGYASSIWANFGTYIENRRGVVPGYGLGLELFLKAAKPRPV